MRSLITFFMFAFSLAPAAASAADDLWAAHVEPVLRRNCFKCHGDGARKSGLDLRAPDSILQGGERGAALVPGKPGESRIVRFVRRGSDPHMPPGDRQLTDEEIALLERWVAAEKTEKIAAPASNNAGASPAPSSGPASSGGAVPAVGGAAAAPRWGPPEGVDVELAIDLCLERGWHERRVRPAPPCDDETYARRLFLDLAGRIPTLAEREAFLAETDSRKRERLADRLLAGPDYPRRLRELLEFSLLGRPVKDQARQREARGFRAYLEWAARTDRSWDRVVKDLLVARPGCDEERGAAYYLIERGEDHQAMAEGAARALLGLRVECARCHRHPLAHEIEQKHYWGLVAFFNRTKPVETARGLAPGESATGGFIRFADLKGNSFDATLAFLDGRSVEEARPKEGEKEIEAPEKYLVPPPASGKSEKAPVPKFSRREQLAELLDDSPLPARAIVNRIWAALLGRGIVHPVDRMDSIHPASHPELLDWLAADLRAHQGSLRRLVRGIVLSRAYALDSRPAVGDGAVSEKNAPPPSDDAFARALLRPIPAESLARSALIAQGNDRPEDLRACEEAFIAAFPEAFPEDFNATVQEALFLSNDAAVDRILEPLPGTLTARVAGAEPRAAVEAAHLAVLGRMPTAEELEASARYLQERADRREAAAKHLVWALLAGPEFRLNH